MPEDKIPQSPEEYPPSVREELEQTDVSHVGEEREGDNEEMSDHLGARESEPTPVTPPMTGPSKVTEGTLDDAGIEPREELTGG
ncbi:MAG: hypothetical protein ACRDIB_05840 [Ardenticatenaceae bacterium]